MRILYRPILINFAKIPRIYNIFSTSTAVILSGIICFASIYCRSAVVYPFDPFHLKFELSHFSR